MDTLITESEPMLLTMHASLKGLTVQGIPHRQVPLAMLEAEACCIARAQFLYCCVRLLGVAPVDELFRLRLFVWSLSAGCLLRRREKMKDVTQDKNSGHQYTSVNSDCMAAIIMRSQRANAEELIDLDALARAESNGRSLIQSTISEEAKSPRDWRRGGYGTLGSVAWETLSVLHALVVACYNALKAARGYNLTDGVDKLKAILQSLLDLSCTIAMTSSFGVVRLMNIEFRSAKKRLAMTQNGYASNDNKMTGMREDTQDVSKVQYCWCHGSEFGRMICCDDCEEWFHCSCMGLEKRVNLKNIIGFCCIACAEEKQVSYEFEWS